MPAAAGARPAPTAFTAPTSAAPAGRNAFAAMMRAASVPPPRDDFTLVHIPAEGGRAEEAWEWRWRSSGAPLPPSWAPLLPHLRTVATASLKLHPSGKPTEVQLRTNVPPFDGAPPRAPDGGCKLSPSLLMSALQKAVRRGLADAALRVAAELWARDPLVALRRVIIISVEDALPHPALPLLTWLMLAASQRAPPYALGPPAAAAFLAVVRDLARCGAREGVPLFPDARGPRPWLVGLRGAEEAGGEEAGGAPPPPAPPWAALPAPARGADGAAGGLLLSGAQLDALGEGGACLVRSLLVRALYGGMKGDVDMLKSAALLWALRFAHDAVARAGGGAQWAEPLRAHAPPPGSGAGGWAALLSAHHGAAAPAYCSLRGPLPPLRSVPRLTAADVPLAAVDYHVSDIVEGLLGAAHAAAALGELRAGGVAAEAAADVVKEAMWELRSAVNGRPPVRGGGAAVAAWRPPPHVARAWAILEPLADAWAAELLRKRF